MGVCVYVCMCVCVYVCLPVLTYVSVDEDVSVCLCGGCFVYNSVCMFCCLCIFMCSSARVYVYVIKILRTNLFMHIS